MFDEIVDDMLQGANDRDYVSIVFNAPQLDKPVSMPFVKRNQLDRNAFSAKLESALQSHKEVSLDVSFNIIHLQMPEGGKNIKRYAKLNENDPTIENDPNYKSIRQSYGKQTDYERALHREVGVPFGKCGVEEIKRFENTRRMQNYKVMVISKENLNAIIYIGPEDREHTIYLYSHDLATSLSAFYERVMEIHSNPPIIYILALTFLFI